MPAQAPLYLSFMLRCWQEQSQTPGQPVVWRFSLEDVETGERLGFANLQILTVFLQEQTGPPDVGQRTDNLR